MPADVLAPNGARTSASSMMTKVGGLVYVQKHHLRLIFSHCKPAGTYYSKSDTVARLSVNGSTICDVKTKYRKTHHWKAEIILVDAGGGQILLARNFIGYRCCHPKLKYEKNPSLPLIGGYFRNMVGNLAKRPPPE